MALVGHAVAVGAALLPYLYYDAGTADLEAGGRFGVAFLMLVLFVFAELVVLGAAVLTAYAFDLDRFLAGLGAAGWLGILLICGVWTFAR